MAKRKKSFMEKAATQAPWWFWAGMGAGTLAVLMTPVKFKGVFTRLSPIGPLSQIFYALVEAFSSPGGFTLRILFSLLGNLSKLINTVGDSLNKVESETVTKKDKEALEAATAAYQEEVEKLGPSADPKKARKAALDVAYAAYLQGVGTDGGAYAPETPAKRSAFDRTVGTTLEKFETLLDDKETRISAIAEKVFFENWVQGQDKVDKDSVAVKKAWAVYRADPNDPEALARNTTPGRIVKEEVFLGRVRGWVQNFVNRQGLSPALARLNLEAQAAQAGIVLPGSTDFKPGASIIANLGPRPGDKSGAEAVGFAPGSYEESQVEAIQGMVGASHVLSLSAMIAYRDILRVFLDTGGGTYDQTVELYVASLMVRRRLLRFSKMSERELRDFQGLEG